MPSSPWVVTVVQLAVSRRSRIIGNARVATIGTAIRHGELKSFDPLSVRSALFVFAGDEQQQLNIVSTQT